MCLIGECVWRGEPKDPQTYIMFVGKEVFESRAVLVGCILQLSIAA